MSRLVEQHRRKLPHLQLEGQIVFLTWRLAFTLPQSALALAEELKALDLKSSADGDLTALRGVYASKQAELDIYLGKCDLADFSLCEDGIGEMMGDAIKHYAGKLYRLHCFCVMPNHVHLLLQSLADAAGRFHRDSAILQRLKSYTAHQINQRRAHSGPVWQNDYFDRFIRDQDDYYNVVEYILNNPLAAGLTKRREDWPYSYFEPGLSI